jgi:hypothetical protein
MRKHLTARVRVAPCKGTGGWRDKNSPTKRIKPKAPSKANLAVRVSSVKCRIAAIAFTNTLRSDIDSAMVASHNDYSPPCPVHSLSWLTNSVNHERWAHLSMRTFDWLRQRSDLKYQVLYMRNIAVEKYWLILSLPFCPIIIGYLQNTRAVNSGIDSALSEIAHRKHMNIGLCLAYQERRSARLNTLFICCEIGQ